MSKQIICLACGVAGCGNKDYICGKCGDPEKTMMVCRGCRKRTDLTLAGPTMIKDFFAKINPSLVADNVNISRGTTIVIPVCSSCRGNRNNLPNGKALIYKVRGERR